jgi:D-3-phosphoglycerate dehydrogenase / 2-oxoglutarate reductase
MNLMAFDPYANPSLAAAANVELLSSMDELLEQADFLTIHTPMIASTKGIISGTELSKMKRTARILNVARGGIVDEAALLSALEAGTIAGAGMDVFTTEPPQSADAAFKLIEHPNVVATPHLGASTVEAQENVSIDVCEQVISILSGQLPRSAVNAPIMLPEEYRILQPFVTLLEKMGSLYTQHFGPSNSKQRLRTTFELTYEGTLASTNNTKPLFASLVKGLVSPVTSTDTLNINIVNAELIAKERGILISESKSREKLEQDGYSASVTLKARLDPRSPSATRRSNPMDTPGRQTTREKRIQDQIITGFVVNNQPYISRLGRFTCQFVPTGTLLICRNYDEPGKIGEVGGKLGKEGVNIRFMSVAPIEAHGNGNGNGRGLKVEQNGEAKEKENEALMILGVDRPVGEEVRKALEATEGVLEASVILL